jgi:hypothetical protein
MKPYLFLHIPKTGGTSIAEVLPHGRTTSEPLQCRLRQTFTPVGYGAKPHHYTLEQYEKCGITKIKDFNNLYKFAFVRNPWDRVVSMYAHFLRAGSFYIYPDSPHFSSRLNFVKFVRDMMSTLEKDLHYLRYEGHVVPQIKYTHDSEGNQIIDFIGKYETITKDLGRLNEICDWGLSEIRIPHLNKADKEYKDYRDYYYDGHNITKEIVAEIFAAEIELYGYEF